MRNVHQLISTLVVLVGLGGPARAAQGEPILFGVNSGSGGDYLMTIDPATGASVRQGDIDFYWCGGLAFGFDGVLYATDNFSYRLVTLDPQTGQSTTVGPYGLGRNLECLAFRPATGELFGVDYNSGRLVRVDTASGYVSNVGAVGMPDGLAAMTFSADGSVLYAADWFTAAWYKMNPNTGQALLIASGTGVGAGRPLGLATDPGDGRIYMAVWHEFSDATLEVVDPSTGTRSIVGIIPQSRQLEGLAFRFHAPGQSECFGDGTGTPCPCGNSGAPGEGCSNSSGSGAVLRGRGTASILGDDLVLELEQARPNGFALFLQGGSLAVQPFRDGLLCVGDPTIRLEAVSIDAGGSASSSISLATKGGVNAGESRWYQAWFRDRGPNAPCATGSNLSSAYRVAWQ